MMKQSLILIIVAFSLLGCYTTPKKIHNMIQESGRQYVENNPDISEETKEDILNGRVRIGMTPEQVRVTWGPPSDVSESINRRSSYMLWQYRHSYQSYKADVDFKKDIYGVYRVDRLSRR